MTKDEYHSSREVRYFKRSYHADQETDTLVENLRDHLNATTPGLKVTKSSGPSSKSAFMIWLGTSNGLVWPTRC